jgi:hypothetical protein
VNVHTSSFTVSPRYAAAGFTLLSLFAAVILGQAIVSSDYRKLAIWIALALVLSLSLFILRNWRLGVFTFFVWILFEDFVRKWLGNEMALYFVKDVLIGITYLSYFLFVWRFRQERVRNQLRVPLLMMFGWACAQSVNAGVSDILVPVVGLRMSFLYVPMLYLGYSFFRDERELKRFFILTLTLSIFVSVLGIVQSIVGVEFLNPESAPNLRLTLIRVAPGSNLLVPRPTSTFVDPGRYAQYLFIIVYVGFGILGYILTQRPKASLRLRLLIILSWVVALVALFISGQRAAIVWLILSVPVVGGAYLYGMGPQRRARHRFPASRLLFTGALGLYLVSVFFPLRYQAVFDFYQKTINPTSQYSEFETRPRSYWGDIVKAFQSSGLTGHGTGTASLGLQYIASYRTGQVIDVHNDRTGVYNTEGGYASVLWEWGVVGLCLWLLWTTLLLYKLIQEVRRLRHTRFYWLAVAVTLYAFFLLFPWFYFGIQVYQQYVAQAFLWFMVGMVFRLPLAQPQERLGREAR